MNFPIYIFIFAATLDFLIGDPVSWLHPVQVMGWFISKLSQLALKFCHNRFSQRFAGVVIGVTLILGSGVVAGLIIHFVTAIHPLVGMIFQIIMLSSCFALGSLTNAAKSVLNSLATGDIEQTRSILSGYVGRDTANLTEAEILRAVLETVAENATDGVMAPLFYAIVGGFIPFIGALPFAFAYKASSTLDSMIGYKTEPYIHIGWFSARFEDYFTWIPCRFAIITLALISAKPGEVWRICRRDAPQDPSPNSGWSESAYAAVLGVQMGGVNSYQGITKYKPLLGDSIYPIKAQTIYKALQLTRNSFLLWLGVSIVIAIALSHAS
ncbi:adenosylcobinamide-phosphate synthase CbiB [Calothrix sp. PCC 6303]|uniref:adenosylcobinamide-phosphate synthase CbiB n=1 Tax=Calothrix sp. PCC 6303 TaxID=1170562 RepID=UPI0002A04940|nr:adenosylcobinamide-phosphate synthase CbiB [Calothrix sp. PCC 6303]AFZ04228.1 adenosylcobinamide-phosphate synthase [Calothrix sp. PCC 6303]